MGWADKNPNDFSFLDHEIPLVVYSIFSLNCDGLLMGVALSPPDGPASKQHRLINHIANEKNKQTTGVPGVVSEIKEQSFSVKKVIACAGLIESCLSTDGNTNTQRGND